MTKSTWGLALDGARARIVRDLEHHAPGEPLPEELGLEVQPKRTGEIMSDRPGRSFASVGPGRSAMEYASDPRLEEERAFCEEVLWLLGSHLKRGDFDRLVIAAAPRALGFLRNRRSRDMAAVTVAETAKDYLHLTPTDLRQKLRDMMPSRLG